MAVSWSYTRETAVDIATRYLNGIAEEVPVLVGAACVIGLWIWMSARRFDVGAFRWPLILGMSLAGLRWAWSLRWIGDDAFISFRYARNLLEGNGLVYNVGERVEGYTNFLWTLLVAAAGLVGFDIVQASVVLSLVCFVLTIVLIAVLTTRLSGVEQDVAFPLAAAAFAASYGSASFATSGLETMFCTLAVVFALERALSRSYFLSGLGGIVATMAHPDHALFYAGLGAALALSRAPRAALVRYGIPFLLLFVPYFAWRWSYYGYFFPNTFYAKSGAGWHLQQGGRYLGLCALALGLWGVFPLALSEAFKRRGELVGRYAWIVFPLYLLYLLKIGGDFMLGRLVVVLLPLTFVLAELFLRRLVASRRWVVAALAGVAFVFCALPSHLIRPGEKYLAIADERTFYPLRSFSPIEVGNLYTDWARTFNELFEGAASTPKVATGIVGIFGYETGLHLVDIYGLLDPVVAHKPIRKRGRPGHEKRSSPARILELGTDLSDMSIYPPPFEVWTEVHIPPFPLYMPRYDPALVRQLNADGDKRARAFEPFLQRIRPSARRDRRDCQRWFIETYYFSNNQNKDMRSELQERFASTEGVEALQALLFGESPSGWVRTPVETFDGTSALTWEYDGESFFDAVTSEARTDQNFVGGHQGPFVDSFDPESGERGRLRFTSSKLEISGEALTFQIGGGRSESLQVELLLDGVPVRASTGCDSDLMGRRIWDVRALRGQSVQLRIRDDDDGGEPWGHIVADTFEQWVRKAD